MAAFPVPEPGPGLSRAGGERRGRRALVADDEPHIVRLIQVNLEQAGYEVVTAFNGREALAQVAAQRPDFLILDVMMPYMDGFEMLQALRRSESTRDLPVIMLTSKAQDADVFQGWQSGVDSYLTKPFTPAELMAFVRRLLR